MTEPNKELTELAQRLILKTPKLSVIPDTEDYPWFVREFQRTLQAQEQRGKLLLPNIRDQNETVAIFTDYGGEAKGSKFLTYSFLICAYSQTGNFTQAMKALRAQSGLDNPFKEIAYKDLGYGPLDRALERYLTNLSNLVNGYLLTVVVDKSIDSLFGPNKETAFDFTVRTLSSRGLGDWKPRVAEKALRIAHFAAYLVALLSRKDQRIFWMTDHDSIASNDKQFETTVAIFSNLVKHYTQHDPAFIGYATPFDDKQPDFLDLLSASDLVAGSIEHYLSRSHTAASDTLAIRAGADMVLRWLCEQGLALKRHSMIIRPEGDNITCGTLAFNLKEPARNGCVISVSPI